MRTLNARDALLISAASGAVLWLGLGMLAGRREAWDSPAYFSFGLPALMVVLGIVGYLTSERPWRLGAAAMASQALIATIQNPTANLLPLGWIFFAILSVPCMLSARIGVYVRSLRAAGGGDRS